ncbi:MAG: nickel-responsive transcriptional regulator NikR [Alphaproteobacteria bacterium CG_4_10_14_0_2_um_filter_63_37]|nr:MAG: nickel responsive regulator [Proteobacteria bacterium CG1_02_64_396]PJA23587.1 MAG: nickel-responsive transcriptional regulator NikR [Alphaproteobacteria bacterium CG_4_10_14_0_2_um_filter_63_37]
MTRPDDLTRFSVSLPNALLEELDRKVAQTGYASRSEYIRDLLREQLVEESWEEGKGQVFGVLTIVYDHHQPGLATRIMDVQHHHHAGVRCTTHLHIDHDHCLEAIILEGPPEEVEGMAASLKGLKGVRLARLTRAGRVDY